MNETAKKTIEEVAELTGKYPPEAFEFVRHGLSFAVERVHGDARHLSDAERHVSGQQLALGLKDYALSRYGLMARTVLAHWGITKTSDFGRIVYAMVENRLMQKTDHDDVRHFDNVFDFADAFDPPKRPTLPATPIFKL